MSSPLIWIVDDSPTEAAMTRHALGTGYRFETFGDGSTVVERLAAAKQLPELVVLDWEMPGMTGDEVCRFLRSRPETRELPIILVTASRLDTSDIVAGLAIGANDYVPRPFAPEELRARVDAVLRTKTLADRATKFHQEMLAIVGHDLRSPLGAVFAGAELLEEHLREDPAAARPIRAIKNSAMRMTRIIEQLLDVTHARLGTGIPVERRDTQLQPVAAAVVEELALAYPKQRFELRGDVDVHGMWDPDRLGQVISNLSSNAMQYGLVGEPIVIELACTATTASIAVTNAVRTAPIAPEAIATLFEPYRRGATAGYAQGLGLGLYIVHEIVRAHRGHIAVESTMAGTTFKVILPLAAEE